MDIGDFQDFLRRTYGARDAERGVLCTFAWLVEEIGELSRALRDGGEQEVQREGSDVLAWLVSLANLLGVDLSAAAERYAHGCPRFGRSPCGYPASRADR